MVITFRHSVKGLGYFGGDTAELPDDLASDLVKGGAAVLVPETDDGEKNPLPEDLPMRNLLWENGYESVEQILDASETLTDIKGIGPSSADRIVQYCTEAVELKLHDALNPENDQPHGDTSDSGGNPPADPAAGAEGSPETAE